MRNPFPRLRSLSVLNNFSRPSPAGEDACAPSIEAFERENAPSIVQSSVSLCRRRLVMPRLDSRMNRTRCPTFLSAVCSSSFSATFIGSCERKSTRYAFFSARRSSSVKPARRRPNVLTPRTIGGFPSVVMFLRAGRSSNGRTPDSGSGYRGSSPCLPAK